MVQRTLLLCRDEDFIIPLTLIGVIRNFALSSTINSLILESELISLSENTNPDLGLVLGYAFLVNRSTLLLFTFIIINILLVIDTSIVRISTFTGGMYPFENYMIIFVLVYAGYATGNVIIMRLVNSQIHSGLGAKSLLFKSFFAGITATQYVILFMIFILIFQILTNKFYSIWILKSISYNSRILWEE